MSVEIPNTPYEGGGNNLLWAMTMRHEIGIWLGLNRPLPKVISADWLVESRATAPVLAALRIVMHDSVRSPLARKEGESTADLALLRAPIRDVGERQVSGVDIIGNDGVGVCERQAFPVSTNQGKIWFGVDHVRGFHWGLDDDHRLAGQLPELAWKNYKWKAFSQAQESADDDVLKSSYIGPQDLAEATKRITHLNLEKLAILLQGYVQEITSRKAYEIRVREAQGTDWHTWQAGKALLHFIRDRRDEHGLILAVHPRSGVPILRFRSNQVGRPNNLGSELFSELDKAVRIYWSV